MLEEKKRLIFKFHKYYDIFFTIAAFIASYVLKNLIYSQPAYGESIPDEYYFILLLIIIIWFIVLDMTGLYTPYRSKRFNKIIFETIQAVVTSFVLLIVCLYLIKIEGISRVMMGCFLVLDIAVLGLYKYILYFLLANETKSSLHSLVVCIVGSKDRARTLIDLIETSKDKRLKIIGCLETDKSLVGTTINYGYKVFNTINNIATVLTAHVIDELIFAMPLEEIEYADKYIAIAEDIGVSVRIIPDWPLHYFTYHSQVVTIGFEDFLGIPSMHLSTTTPYYAKLMIKSMMDYSAAFIAVVLLLPLFIAIAIMIKLVSRGPVFFSQLRYGLNGRIINVHKFRTMHQDAEERLQEVIAFNEADGPAFKIKNDPRIISYVGTFLRKTSLDELPQLINILKGEMSLVGPRPPIPGEVSRYELWQRRRLSMKPGITCIWQISPNRNDISFEEWMEKDLEYIDNWSLWLDFKIIFKTVWVMLAGEGR
ncbi:MAG: sugar transferase [Proteobacteria bacterium]|nr:sugar transferase [Pseudomonadota bacterium]